MNGTSNFLLAVSYNTDDKEQELSLFHPDQILMNVAWKLDSEYRKLWLTQ